MPTVIVARGPKAEISRPENGEKTAIGTVTGRISAPATMAPYPSSVCRY